MNTTSSDARTMNQKREQSERMFARSSLKNYQIYLALKDHESDPRLTVLFEELAAIAKHEFDFWGTKVPVRGDEAGRPFFVWFYIFLRRALGVTLTTHLIINRERTKLAHFEVYCVDCLDTEERKAIDAMATRSLALVPTSEDPHYRFFSYIVLGFNDALIELTGALIGFSFALRDPKIVTIAGLVSGISAAASMAASAYLQAEHEPGKDPHRAALYTGISYLGIAMLLVLPFVVTGSVVAGNIGMVMIAFVLVLILALYSSVVLGKGYLRQMRQILSLSLGVAFITFSVGYFLNLIFINTK